VLEYLGDLTSSRSRLSRAEEFLDLHFPELGAYMCRRYAEVASGPNLVSFTLARDVTMPHHPGETSGPPRHDVLLEQICN
jgi:hypothetical protein